MRYYIFGNIIILVLQSSGSNGYKPKFKSSSIWTKDEKNDQHVMIFDDTRINNVTVDGSNGCIKNIFTGISPLLVQPKQQQQQQQNQQQAKSSSLSTVRNLQQSPAPALPGGLRPIFYTPFFTPGLPPAVAPSKLFPDPTNVPIAPLPQPPTTIIAPVVNPVALPTTLAPVILPTTLAPVILPTTLAPVILPTTLAPVILPTTIAPVVALPTVASPVLVPTVPTTLAPFSVAPMTAPMGGTNPPCFVCTSETAVVSNPYDIVKVPPDFNISITETNCVTILQYGRDGFVTESSCIKLQKDIGAFCRCEQPWPSASPSAMPSLTPTRTPSPTTDTKQPSGRPSISPTTTPTIETNFPTKIVDASEGNRSIQSIKWPGHVTTLVSGLLMVASLCL